MKTILTLWALGKLTVMLIAETKDITSLKSWKNKYQLHNKLQMTSYDFNYNNILSFKQDGRPRNENLCA